MSAYSSLVWDNHACMPLRPQGESFLPQLERYRAAGVDIVTLNVAWDGMPADTGPKMLALFRHWLRDRSEAYLLVETAEDLDRAKESGRLGVLFDIEGGAALAEQLSMVSLYYDLGVRWMSIAYNRANAVGGGILDDPDPGLTDFGRAVLDEMARVGMVACCSHTGHRTAAEVLERSRNPVIFSHSNPSAVHAHPRNIGDDLIRACALTGGTVGIVGIGDFLGEASVEHFVRHADYVAQLVGPEHVALGLDYVFDLSELEELVAADPERFDDGMGVSDGFPMVAPEQLPQIIEALARCGWSEAALAMLLGGNLHRIARQVWKPVPSARRHVP